MLQKVKLVYCSHLSSGTGKLYHLFKDRLVIQLKNGMLYYTDINLKEILRWPNFFVWFINLDSMSLLLDSFVVGSGLK